MRRRLSLLLRCAPIAPQWGALVFLLLPSLASAQDAAPSAAAAITPQRTSYRCRFADDVERTLTVNAGQSFPLSVRRCEPIERPAVDSPPPPVPAPPVPAADDRLPSVTWIEAPTAGRAGHSPHEPVASEAANEAAIEWAPQVRRASQRHGVDAQLVDAVIHVESRHRAAARSSKGALGLMQVMPATGARYGVARAQDLLDPATNLDVGVRYLRDLLVMFEGRTELALAAYNAGEGNVLRHGLRVPPFPETQGYVEQVLTRYAQLRSMP